MANHKAASENYVHGRIPNKLSASSPGVLMRNNRDEMKRLGLTAVAAHVCMLCHVLVGVGSVAFEFEETTRETQFFGGTVRTSRLASKQATAQQRGERQYLQM